MHRVRQELHQQFSLLLAEEGGFLHMMKANRWVFAMPAWARRTNVPESHTLVLLLLGTATPVVCGVSWFLGTVQKVVLALTKMFQKKESPLLLFSTSLLLLVSVLGVQ